MKVQQARYDTGNEFRHFYLAQRVFLCIHGKANSLDEYLTKKNPSEKVKS